ncbi:hypothetical protein [Desulfatibacillum aliphaticivorans]|uniref:hypothetical protein n=1 Tax=Desulfatibacillum aliphaticivorans TaxID=218208 RepID=UPI000487407E|nr:hypothetical protein [Desulfatibacillum aliphaticivorans]
MKQILHKYPRRLVVIDPARIVFVIGVICLFFVIQLKPIFASPCEILEMKIKAADIDAAEAFMNQNKTRSYCAIYLVDAYNKEGNSVKARNLMVQLKDLYNPSDSQAYSLWLYYSLYYGIMDNKEVADRAFKRLEYISPQKADQLKNENAHLQNKAEKFMNAPWTMPCPEIEPFWADVFHFDVDRIENICRYSRLLNEIFADGNVTKEYIQPAINDLEELERIGVDVQPLKRIFATIHEYYNLDARAKTANSSVEKAACYKRAVECLKIISKTNLVKFHNLPQWREIDKTAGMWGLAAEIDEALSAGASQERSLRLSDLELWTERTEDMQSLFKVEPEYENCLSLLQVYVSMDLSSSCVSEKDPFIEFLDAFDQFPEQPPSSARFWSDVKRSVVRKLHFNCNAAMEDLHNWLYFSKSASPAQKIEGCSRRLLRRGEDFEAILLILKSKRYLEYLDSSQTKKLSSLDDQWKIFKEVMESSSGLEKGRKSLGLDSEIISVWNLQQYVDIAKNVEIMENLIAEHNPMRAAPATIVAFESADLEPLLKKYVSHELSDEVINIYKQFIKSYHRSVMYEAKRLFENQASFLAQRLSGPIYSHCNVYEKSYEECRNLYESLLEKDGSLRNQHEKLSSYSIISWDCFKKYKSIERDGSIDERHEFVTKGDWGCRFEDRVFIAMHYKEMGDYEKDLARGKSVWDAAPHEQKAIDYFRYAGDKWPRDRSALLASIQEMAKNPLVEKYIKDSLRDSWIYHALYENKGANSQDTLINSSWQKISALN